MASSTPSVLSSLGEVIYTNPKWPHPKCPYSYLGLSGETGDSSQIRLLNSVALASHVIVLSSSANSPTGSLDELLTN
ncbi:hypothetical protein F2Q70_00027115 [Brassica cretica]|uniref:Uncharacterized protein n=2 Tax=Brassica cretica TaxID=69181 RepID=A0A8S9L789_BRACR|nr:hypothetical protein F2Q68_00026645 [Brassica cretica]KAF2602062.1 hypothetical protein F2Q70_00027115 [Brassica cretica]KAF3581855.1 hypothetical protein DY000_02033186 [Brassica cretica]